MVFGIVSLDSDVMPLHIFPEGLRVNSDVYIELLKTKVLPWIKKVAKDRPWVWQQDSAPCHTSEKSICWILSNFYDFNSPQCWPLNSPDLNPMDFFVWGAIEWQTNRTPCKSKDDLIDWVTREFRWLLRLQIVCSCSCFWSHIEAVIAAKGGFIE